MSGPLRPSTLGEVLDRTVSLYRAHFLAFLGIAAPPAAVVMGCMGALVLLLTTPAASRPGPSFALGMGALGIFLLGVPLFIAAGGLSYAALSHAASAASLDEPVSIRGSYRWVGRQGWRYLGLYLLQALLVAGVPFAVWTAVLIALAIISRKAGAAAGGAPAAIMLLSAAGLGAYAVWMLLRVCLAFPVSVVEEAGPWSSLRRAASLSQGTRGRIFVLYLLGVAVGWILSILLLSPMSLLMLIPGMDSPQKAQTAGVILVILFYAISFAVQALTRPIYGIALVLFYYDQRVRREGWDIELLMRQAGMFKDAASQPEAAPRMPTIVADPQAGSSAVLHLPPRSVEDSSQEAGGPV